MSREALEELTHAIEEIDADAVRALLASGRIDVNARLPREDVHSPHVFQYAACYLSDENERDILEMLLNAGADINGTDLVGGTACHEAAWFCNVALLRFLHAHGANLGAVDANVRMPLDIAFEQEHADPRDFVIALVELGAPLVANNISLYAVASASTTCIQALLDRGIAVGELRSTHLETPLFVNWHSDVTTTNHDQVALLNMLVNVCGVDIHARDSFGKTSCHRAIWDGNFPKLQWLIEAGADIDAADIEGKTQLHMLKRNPDFGWLLLLVAAGANVYARDNNGDTACHLVASLYEHDAKLWVNTLLASATNDLLDVPNQLGVTPRQLLAQRNLVVGNVAEVELARRRIARRRLRFVSRRALQVCIGLEPLHLDALQTCEILVHACGCLATLVPFHQWWKIATAVKHFNK